MAKVFWRNCVNTKVFCMYQYTVLSSKWHYRLVCQDIRSWALYPKNINKALINYHLLLIINYQDWIVAGTSCLSKKLMVLFEWLIFCHWYHYAPVIGGFSSLSVYVICYEQELIYIPLPDKYWSIVQLQVH